jgi:hypothetical protein
LSTSIGKPVIVQRTCGAVEAQQAARPAFGRRGLCNQFLGEVVIKIVKSHRADYTDGYSGWLPH